MHDDHRPTGLPVDVHLVRTPSVQRSADPTEVWAHKADAPVLDREILSFWRAPLGRAGVVELRSPDMVARWDVEDVVRGVSRVRRYVTGPASAELARVTVAGATVRVTPLASLATWNIVEAATPDVSLLPDGRPDASYAAGVPTPNNAADPSVALQWHPDARASELRAGAGVTPWVEVASSARSPVAGQAMLLGAPPSYSRRLVLSAAVPLQVLLYSIVDEGAVMGTGASLEHDLIVPADCMVYLKNPGAVAAPYYAATWS